MKNNTIYGLHTFFKNIQYLVKEELSINRLLMLKHQLELYVYYVLQFPLLGSKQHQQILTTWLFV